MEHEIRSHRAPSRQAHRIRTGLFSILFALAVTAGAFSLSHRPAQQPELVDLVLPIGAPAELGQWCVDHNTAAFRATLTSAGRNLLKGCVELWGAGLAPSPSPSPSPSATVTPSPSPSTTAAPSPTVSPTTSTAPPMPSPSTSLPSPSTSPTPTPSPTPTAPAGWPSPSTVGVPAGTVLTNYSGPCTITVPNTVLDARHISCTLTIATTGVVIRRSVVDGGILTGRSDTNLTLRLTVEDSRLIGRNGTRGIDGSAYIVRRSHLSSDLSGGWCWRSCLVEGSYIEASGTHTSAFRLQRDGVMRGNVLWCKRASGTGIDGGCSGDLVSYADVIDGQQTIIDGNTLTGNLFKATPGWYCLRAGDGTHWTITGNTFERGAGSCSEQSGGHPVGWYLPGGVGNSWADNRYTDGVLITV